MRKKIAVIVSISIMMINMILLAIPSDLVLAQEQSLYETEKVSEGIEDLLQFNDTIIVLSSDGVAKCLSGDNEVVLKGKNYSVISKKLVINEDGVLFNIEKQNYEDKETAESYIKVIQELKQNNDYDKIYFLDDKIALIKKFENSYEITYYINGEVGYTSMEVISEIETNDIDFDKDGNLYIDGKGILSKYEENKFLLVKEIEKDYKVRVYDENNIILFNENQYITLNDSKDDTNIDKNLNDEEDTAIQPLVEGNVDTISLNESVKYQTHVQYEGWQEFKADGEMSGTSGQALRLEGIRINIENLPAGSKIAYRTHIQYDGWQDWKYDGDMSGTSGESKRLEGIEIKLIDAPKEYHVEYRVHVQDIGWQSWRKDGAMAGTSGLSKRLEAIEIRLVKDLPTMELNYETLVQNEGWKAPVVEGQTSGSDVNNKLQAIKLNFNDPNGVAGIQYRTHVAFEGWHDWVNNSEVSGTIDTDRSLEAFELRLVNAPQDYHIEYRANIKGYGWQGWKRDGQMAGSTGISSEIVGIQIRLVKDIAEPQVSYQTHVQNVGWQDWKNNGEMSGTSGKALRLEGIRIDIGNLPSDNSIMYRTHVQNEGWHGWVANGEMSGTSGKSYRLEAIEIKLENPIPGYEMYYRVHVQDYGWQEWKKNGETAGTVGSAKRLEGIEIKFVKSNNKTIVVDPGHNSGGDYGAGATHSERKFSEADMNMQISAKLTRALEARGYNVIMTIYPGEHGSLSSRDSLYNRVAIANNLNADFFISIHQNSSLSSSAKGVEAFYSSENTISGSDNIGISSRITSSLVNSIASNMNRVNRGAKDEEFYVVNNTKMPSVLLECGFISNAEEAAFFSLDYKQQYLAELIADEIKNYF